MSNLYTTHYNPSNTPQTQPIPGKTMVENNGGGFAFQISPMSQLKRFLVLGTEGHTYYQSEQALTVENAQNVVRMIKENGLEAVKVIVETSVNGRAPKNDAAIFALALAATEGDAVTKKAAYDAISQVCRTGTHIFTFCENVNTLRQWSRGLRNGVSKFYTGKTVDQVAMQVIKYRQRNGWTHKDVLRLAHPHAKNVELNNVLRYAVGKEPTGKVVEGALIAGANHALIGAFEEAIKLKASDKKQVNRAIALVNEYRLPWEALPTEMLGQKEIWEAILPHMPLHALVRNLGKMTSVGVIDSNLSTNTKMVVSKLSDKDNIRKSKLHPLALLNALKVYQQGHGDKGSLSWSPVTNVVDVLDEGFYLAFENVVPTNKNYMLALDISSSMNSNACSGAKLSAREASAALALVTMKTEKNVEVVGFHNQLMDLKISSKMRLNDVVSYINGLGFGSTNPALPMIEAQKKKLDVDVFAVYTDNECNSNQSPHACQALKSYRKAMNKPDAKLACVGMTPTAFSIADPKDRGMMDFVGFSTDSPAVMNMFAAGEI